MGEWWTLDSSLIVRRLILVGSLWQIGITVQDTMPSDKILTPEEHWRARGRSSCGSNVSSWAATAKSSPRGAKE